MDPITFAGAVLDRASERRSDEDWLAAARADGRARAVVCGPGGVLLDGPAPSPGADAWAAGAGRPLAPALVPLDGREAVLLGVREDGSPLWAVEADGEPLAGLREAAPLLAPADAGVLAYAHQLLHWRRTHRFCGVCGRPTQAREGGHMRACPEGHAAHPRTDPVVIMLVTDGADRVLLGRQPSWPPGRYSALAGFVEPGESLEAAVAREVAEEAGVRVRAVRYVASQPWPFPASLMLGFHAEHAGGEPGAHDAELEDARWFTREEVSAAAQESAGAPLKLPPPLAIARRLVEAWLYG